MLIVLLLLFWFMPVSHCFVVVLVVVVVVVVVSALPCSLELFRLSASKFCVVHLLLVRLQFCGATKKKKKGNPPDLGCGKIQLHGFSVAHQKVHTANVVMLTTLPQQDKRVELLFQVLLFKTGNAEPIPMPLRKL